MEFELSPEVKTILIMVAVGVAGNLLVAIGKRWNLPILEDLGARLEGGGTNLVKVAKGKAKPAAAVEPK